jgi:hypothetical protein
MEILDLNLCDYELVEIESVSNTGKIVTMNDIQVQDNETFFLGNGILTHNSAIASFTEIRNPETQAGMPLRGKVLNVYGKAPIDAMENAEVADIVTALNLEFNEQMGDWILDKNPKLFVVKYESIFEVDKDGNCIVKEVVVPGSDKFHINKSWIPVEKLVGHPDMYRGYIVSIQPCDKTINEISKPDYFHFRRSWDFRGFRKQGVAYQVTIDKTTFVCNDIDDILVDGQWQKVSFFLKKSGKTKQTVNIEKVPHDTTLTRFNKMLKPAFDSKLKFSKVYIATDADPDGSAINNLLVNLFHEYFPELFWDSENPFINRITFPMIAAIKGKKTLYYENRPLFEKAKSAGKVDDTYKITYFKGLGSMEKKDWEHVFDNLDDYSFKITDDGHLDELMQIFFDSDAGIRKLWLSAK